jgi:hypothetical protein
MMEASKRVIPFGFDKKHSFYNDNGIEFITMTYKVLYFHRLEDHNGRNEIIC